MSGAFWEQRDKVQEFAAREPDLRLAALAPGYANPPRVRVLDLGCAGGRNAVFLARLGFDILAADSSAGMVAETRSRLAGVLGEEEAARRVIRTPMDDLSMIPDAGVDLVVALGIYHNARSRDEWRRALEETARVTTGGGRILVANFTPDTDPGGDGLKTVPGEPHVFEGFPSGRVSLFHAPELDVEFARAGAYPLAPTRTVTRETEAGRRVTANALYGMRRA